MRQGWTEEDDDYLIDLTWSYKIWKCLEENICYTASNWQKKIKWHIWRWVKRGEKDVQGCVFLALAIKNTLRRTAIGIKKRNIKGDIWITKDCNMRLWNFDKNINKYWYVNTSRKHVLVQNQRWRKIKFQFSNILPYAMSYNHA